MPTVLTNIWATSSSFNLSCHFFALSHFSDEQLISYAFRNFCLGAGGQAEKKKKKQDHKLQQPALEKLWPVSEVHQISVGLFKHVSSSWSCGAESTAGFFNQSTVRYGVDIEEDWTHAV